ncbi:pentapeptide repeat-containing protein [Flavobacterium xinjiangense]|uniref:Pentapeptide repeat-containing protein n=1 Tax=Flavobacterium xinjiangense TaxID=178356 RepID=A0A1M7N5N0_9FLAO|nr:pentapeptide repeat-containing protein [Flavobacterium xinjiangense]SHM98898.1 Pentapeptide repeat-containing protein [Flavobacterium xinjiangense]
MIAQYKVIENKNAAFTDNITTANFQHQQFIDFSSNGKTLTNCDFSYCVFQRVYFKNVKFINCNFTGAKFFDSNLREAEFENCKFHYSLFKYTIVNLKEVLKNLPEWPNAKVLLLQNHKVNANSLGDVKASKRFLLEEIDANKEHWRRAIAKKETYYSNKYAGFENWFRSRFNYYKLILDELIWGHGETPWKIVVNLFLLLLIISFLLSFSTNSSFITFLSSIYKNYKAAAKVFLAIPQHIISDNISIAIIILARYLSLGLYIRIMFNKYSWR